MKGRSALTLIGLLLALPAHAADLPLNDRYTHICSAATGHNDEGEVSLHSNDDGTLTVAVWLTRQVEGGDVEKLGSFCTFSAEPRRLIEVYVTPCYECGMILPEESIANLNRHYFGE
jgi:hypothetical protein